MRAARVRACVAFALATALATPAFAAPPAAPTAADREEARALARRGYELFEAGDYARAIESFRKAEEHYHAPPHWLYIARSQAKLGKLIEAQRSYKRILDEKLPIEAPGPFKEAHASAKAEIGPLEARIPTLVITLTGSKAGEARVTIDGAEVPNAELGVPVRRDPGLHTVAATAPGALPVERTIALTPGAAGERVVVELEPPPPSRVVPAAISFTLGGIGIGVGIAAQILILNAAPEDHLKLRIVEVAGFVAGGIGVGAGILVLALRPKRPAAALRDPAGARGVGSTLELQIGPRSLVLGGTF